MKDRIALVVGARPNYFKAKPILAALEAVGEARIELVHTGQHYDRELYEDLFRQLDLRAPDVYLGAPERDRRLSVPDMILGFSSWCREERPKVVIVVGDVDSTLSSAMGAHASGVPVVHVEAGLRSFDRAMPEEINRVVTDALSSLLLVSDPAGVANLKQEGRGAEDIRLVGNVMIDTLLDRLPVARTRPLAPELEERVAAGPFALLTMHRPSNVDRPEMLRSWRDALRTVCARIPVIFPVHPRTRGSLERHGLFNSYQDIAGLLLTEPLGYLETVRLEDAATLAMTDSAGIQEETSVLDTPCLTLRTTTERPITVSDGTSVLIGEDPEELVRWVETVLAGEFGKRGHIPLWDGKAGERVAQEVMALLHALA